MPLISFPCRRHYPNPGLMGLISAAIFCGRHPKTFSATKVKTHLGILQYYFYTLLYFLCNSMQYQTQIHFCNLTTLSDARYAAGVWAHSISFCLDKNSRNYITPLKVKEITGWINGPEKIGEFGHQNPQEITELLNLIGLDKAEIPDDYPAHWLSELKVPYRMYLAADSDCKVAGNPSELRVSDITQLQTFQDKYPCILTITENTTAEKITLLKPFGICLQGRKESQPGLASFEQWNNLLEQLEI